MTTAVTAQGPAVPALRTVSSPRAVRRPIGRGTRAIRHTDPGTVRTLRRRATQRPRAARAMKRTTFYAALVGAFLVSAAAMGISAAVDSPRSLMSPTDYGEAKRAIEADSRLALGKCHDEEGQARDVCRAEARADERVRKAELEARYRGTVGAAADAKLARAKAKYDVARVRCGAERGEDRLSCLKAARAEKAKAFAESKGSPAT